MTSTNLYRHKQLRQLASAFCCFILHRAVLQTVKADILSEQPCCLLLQPAKPCSLLLDLWTGPIAHLCCLMLNRTQTRQQCQRMLLNVSKSDLRFCTLSKVNCVAARMATIGPRL